MFGWLTCHRMTSPKYFCLWHCLEMLQSLPVGFSANSKGALPFSSLACAASFHPLPECVCVVFCSSHALWIERRIEGVCCSLFSSVDLEIRSAQTVILPQLTLKIFASLPTNSIWSTLTGLPCQEHAVPITRFWGVCVFLCVRLSVCVCVCVCVYFCASFPLVQEVHLPVSWNLISKSSWRSCVSTLFLDILSRFDNHWTVCPFWGKQVYSGSSWLTDNLAICKLQSGRLPVSNIMWIILPFANCRVDVYLSRTLCNGVTLFTCRTSIHINIWWGGSCPICHVNEVVRGSFNWVLVA